jgi:protein-L-isoaspartate(D-aspartate) O-methyltransferase
LAARLRAMTDVEPRVAEAMIAVPRHRFVRWRFLLSAYQDKSLPTGRDTSISQPTFIARVISLAHIAPTDRVLEVGTGSGYTAAVMSKLAREVVTVECLPQLARTARRRLTGYPNVQVIEGDGCHVTDGTFDAILVMAGASDAPRAYTDRLRDRGRLIIPIGQRTPECVRGRMVRLTRNGDQLTREDLMPCEWNELTGLDGDGIK